MKDKIIELLESPDLKRKIKETNHIFSDVELLRIIYEYSKTFDQMISMMGEFSEVASAEASALALEYIKYEREKLKQFSESSEEFVYDLCIKETPDSHEERYICKTFDDVLVCIDEFYKEYTDVGAAETKETRYTVKKRKIFSAGDKFAEDTYFVCTIGENKTILEIEDWKGYNDCNLDNLCSECHEICYSRCDEIMFPNFAEPYAIIRFSDWDGRSKFGVCLYFEGAWYREKLSEFYVLPLDCSSIVEERFDDTFSGHIHVSLPMATLASIHDLDEKMKKNYLAFVEYQKRAESVKF